MIRARKFDEERLTFTGELVVDRKRYPFVLSLGTGHCNVKKEDFEKAPEEIWRKEVGDLLVSNKEIVFDFI